MARTLALPAFSIRLTEAMRVALVTAFAAALILAGEALPF